MRWSLPPLSVGEPAPWFTLPTRGNPTYHFNTLAGRHVLLAFMPQDPQARVRALAAFEPYGSLFEGRVAAALFVTRGTPETSITTDNVPGQRWTFDADGAVSRLYGALGEDGADRPFWMLLDPALRVLARSPIEAPEPIFRQIADVHRQGGSAGAPPSAPVLIVPRVFEPAFCKALIAHYDARGGQFSGVMRDIGGKTVGVLDPMKNRRDVVIDDPVMTRQVLRRISRRLVPEIRRAYDFEATRIERYLVACYDAEEGGYFRPHRDNISLATAHRRFAVSINLNAEDFEGGDLRFPEFGRRTYRPPTGGAVVFCCSLLHEATPVTRGRRYAFLPFLYDDASQAIRDRNAGFLDQETVLDLR